MVSSLESVRIAEWPRSAEEFITLRDRVAREPQGGVAMMVVALLLYAGDEELGRSCLAAAVDRDRLEEGPEGYGGRQLGRRDMQLISRQIGSQPYVPRSYVKGATPENGYELPGSPYLFEFSYNPYSGDPESGTYKAFVVCSGAASPRPVTVCRDDRGTWKAREWSSLLVGIRKPVESQDG